MVDGYGIKISVVDEATAKLKAINKELDQARAPMVRLQRETDKYNKRLLEGQKDWQAGVEAFAKGHGLERVGDTFQRIGATSNRASSSVGTLASSLKLLAGPALLYGLERAAHAFAEYGTSLRALSAVTGTTPAALNAITGAGTLNGIKPQAMQSSLHGLAQAMQEAINDPGGVTARTFAARNIDPRSLTQWQAESPDKQMSHVADAMQQMVAEKKSGASQEQQLRDWGIDPSLLPTLQKGGKSYLDDVDKANKLNPWTPEMQANAEKLSKAFGESELQLTHLRNTVVDNLTPALLAASSSLGKFATYIADDLIPKIKKPWTDGTLLTKEQLQNNSSLGRGLTDEQKKNLPDGDTEPDWFQRFKRDQLPWLNPSNTQRTAPNGVPSKGPIFGPQQPVGDSTIAPPLRALMETIAGPESGGDYTRKNGTGHFSDDSKFPEGIGPDGTSTGSGKYQFTSDTWNTEVAPAIGAKDFSPKSQDQGAAFLMRKVYRQKTGRDLDADLKEGGHEADVTDALKGRWSSLAGGTQSHQTQDEFNNRLAANMELANKVPIAAGPRAQVAANQNKSDMPLGLLDININGNVPGTTISASARGNVFGGPPKVQQVMPSG